MDYSLKRKSIIKTVEAYKGTIATEARGFGRGADLFTDCFVQLI